MVLDSATVRLPVSPKTVTVLGSNVTDTDPAWTGLFLDKADLLTQSSIMLMVCGSEAPRDIHLSVPWCHPEDRTGTEDDWTDCQYRVRPKMEVGGFWKRRKILSVDFERVNGKWQIALTVQPTRADLRKIRGPLRGRDKSE